jgi:uncharacterized cupredoxin-like copper-binding protein
MKLKKLFAALAACALPFAAGEAALAAGAHAGGHGSAAFAFGAPGDKAKATRTVEVVKRDNFYEPETISVRAGETVRFVVKNEGQLVHEFQIGTFESFEKHAPMMQMMVDHGVLEADRINKDVAKSMQASMGHGMHDEPNSALLEPGQSGEVVWTFPMNGEIGFACTVPGHYEAGMEGAFELTR